MMSLAAGSLAWLVLVPASFAAAAAAAGAEPTPLASITEAAGTATVLRAGTGETVEAEEDLELAQGDRVQTGPDGDVTITFLDRHFVKLGNDSTLDLAAVTADAAAGTFLGRVRLLGGSLLASFERLAGGSSGFAVETDTTVAAVKGTTFAVEAGAQGSVVSVAEGTVAASGRDAAGKPQGAVDVGEGQETAVSAQDRRPAAPRAISAERAWIRERLAGAKAAAERHRAMKRSGDLWKLRRLRRLAREGRLDRAGPALRAYLAAHPEIAERLKAHAARHQRALRRREGNGKPDGAEGRKGPSRRRIRERRRP